MKNIPLNFIKKYISEKENRKFYFTKKKKKRIDTIRYIPENI